MTRLFGILLICCALVLGGVWVAAQVDLTTFQPDTPILSAEVNANFDALDEALATLAERDSVATLNALTGAVELVAGANIDLQTDVDGGTITIVGSGAGGSAGVEALNALTGAVELVAGANIDLQIDAGSGTITIVGGAPVPSGAVMAFNQAACPDGWSVFTSAQGRTIVGADPAGSLGGTVGNPLADLEARQHSHVVDSQDLNTSFNGNHSHVWATFSVSNGDEIWTSGAGEEIFRWENGIGTDGSGIFPLATDGSDTFDNFFTSDGGNHSHDVFVPSTTTTTAQGHLPYVQLLYCQRD